MDAVSWAAHTRMRSVRLRFFSMFLPPGAQDRLRAQRAKAESFAARWGYESFETDWRRLVDSKEIDLIDIASPNDTHAEIAIAAARSRQDGDVRKAAGPQSGGVGGYGQGGRKCRRAEYGVVQLPARSGRDFS